MSGLHDIPERIFKLIESGVVAESSTLTASGVPIDTPTYYFPARARLEYEAQRRGQPLPAIPLEPPPRTRIALLRQARSAGNAPITGITEEHGNRTT